MQPSSLIFLVILGVWAAFFLQYWMRRRELIATARSVDRFSHTMRVLAVRTDDCGATSSRVAAPGAAAPFTARPSSAAFAVSRSRPVASATAPSGASLRARSASPAVATGQGDLLDPRLVPSVHPIQGALAMRPRRVLRGLVLLIGLLGTAVFFLLAATGVIRWGGLIVPVAMALTGFLWLRRGLVWEANARAAASRSARAGVADGQRRLARDRVPGPRAVRINSAIVADAESAAATVRSDEVYDNSPAASASVSARAVDAHQTSEPAVSRVIEAHDDDLPTTWEPRAVPPPTYAMKARVDRREAGPALVQPRLAELAAFDDDVVPLRPRAANG